MHLNVWQLETLTDWMRKHDDPSDDTLNTAYVTLAKIDTESNVIGATTDAGRYIAIFTDGQDVTDEYPREHATVQAPS